MNDLGTGSAYRLNGYRAYDRAIDAFDPVAWRPPAARRFDARPANDAWDVPPAPRPGAASRPPTGVPAWLVVSGGSLVAAAMGALLGGLLSI